MLRIWKKTFHHEDESRKDFDQKDDFVLCLIKSLDRLVQMKGFFSNPGNNIFEMVAASTSGTFYYRNHLNSNILLQDFIVKLPQVLQNEI